MKVCIKGKNILCELDKLLPGVHCFDELVLRVVKRAKKQMDVYTIFISARTDIWLDSLSISADLNELYGNKPYYVFDASTCTNGWVNIYESHEKKNFVSRDIFLSKTKDGERCLNMAFTTFDRVYTYFNYSESVVSACFNLEGKLISESKSVELEMIGIGNKDPEDFFEEYMRILSARVLRRPTIKRKTVPAGWSSWSCLYGNINEKSITKEIVNMDKYYSDTGEKMLIQIDDGWEKCRSFGGYWTENKDKFPSGMKALSELAASKGMDFGIWIAPALLSEGSPLFNEMKEHINHEEYRVSFSDVHPMDLSDEYTVKYTSDIVKRCVDEYGCSYIKIDFLVNLLHRAGVDGSPVLYRKGYSAQLYKKLVMAIRKSVGNDVFLLACGAPIGESVRYFDAIRTTPDITWGNASSKDHPGFWNIVRKNAQNVFLRSHFYEKVFICDPDALLLRSFLTDKSDDGFSLTDDEAELLCSVIHFSAGTLLINEELDRLSEKRRNMFKSMFPLLDKAARPRDFFEYPYCTEVYIQHSDDEYTVAIYNFTEEPIKKILDTRAYIQGLCTVKGKDTELTCEGEAVFDMRPHTVLIFDIARVK